MYARWRSSRNVNVVPRTVVLLTFLEERQRYSRTGSVGLRSSPPALGTESGIPAARRALARTHRCCSEPGTAAVVQGLYRGVHQALSLAVTVYPSTPPVPHPGYGKGTTGGLEATLGLRPLSWGLTSLRHLEVTWDLVPFLPRPVRARASPGPKVLIPCRPGQEAWGLVPHGATSRWHRNHPVELNAPETPLFYPVELEKCHVSISASRRKCVHGTTLLQA